MTDDDLEELFQTGATTLDDVVAEAVGEDLSGERRDSNPGALALEDVAEVLKVRVPTADAALAQLEGGDVCAAEDLVVGVHVAAHAVGSRVADLRMLATELKMCMWEWIGYLDLEKVLGRSIDLVKALLARIGHGLQDWTVELRAGRDGLAAGGILF